MLILDLQYSITPASITKCTRNYTNRPRFILDTYGKNIVIHFQVLYHKLTAF